MIRERIQHGVAWFRLQTEGRNHFLWLWLWLGMFVLFAGPRLMAQTSSGGLLPNAPVPRGARQTKALPWTVQPCTAGVCSLQNQRLCCERVESRFKAYVRQQTYHVYTRRQLGLMAVNDVVDPFNLLSVLGSAAIVVGSNSHSIYGPGLPGLARASGVTLTENMTDEFFGTFLIPSFDHQAPGFRRMPNRPFWQRLLHCGTQVFWTRSQRGMPMVNYSSLVGTVAEQGVAVSYVPFRRTGWGAAAERVGLDYATAPIGNLINEFVPQVASHMNVRVVFFQNIINRVATTVGQPPTM